MGACVSAALLAACGGNSLVAPGTGAPQSFGSQHVSGSSASHGVRTNTVTESVLYSFGGGSDGREPYTGVTELGGALYGTTQNGGTSDDGTVFEMTPSGAESVLYSFAGNSDGRNPRGAGLAKSGGALFGTTFHGGGIDDGTVFKITTSGSESVLHDFGGGNDGVNPSATLIKVGNAFYGTTIFGGTNGVGTVFKVTAYGTESVIYSFGGGSDGECPYAGLTDVGGVLYGTTANGGTSNDGTVFKITTSGTESVLYSFAGDSDGANPYAGLTDVNGVLYGTTVNGGAPDNEGTVFRITTAGSESVLHNFGSGNDGVAPFDGLTQLGAALYGTTTYGGASGNGTVFKVKIATGHVSRIYTFAGGSDGAHPHGGLTKVSSTLYGTTYDGGMSGNGTVYSLTGL